MNLFNTMFAYDPKNRASMEEILNHAWVNGKTLTLDEIKNEFE